MPPPLVWLFPPEIVRPERVVTAPGSARNTSTAPPPLIVTTLAPGPSITIGPDGPPRSSVLVKVIVCGLDALKTVGANWITLPARLGFILAWLMTYGRVP